MQSGSQYKLSDPPTDGITSVSFNPSDSRYLLASSWDNTARYYDVQDNKLCITFEHDSAVLDACFGAGKQAFTGSLDNKVSVLDLESGSKRVLGKHENSVRCVCWSSNTGNVYTGSWDKTLRVWDPRKNITSENNEDALVSKHELPGKVFSMDLRDNTLVVALASLHTGRHTERSPSIYVYDIRNMDKPQQKRVSTLGYMHRSIRLMPDGTGYANSSIEGRIALDVFDPELKEGSYVFKAHRRTMNDADGTVVVFPVNALAFTSYGTFASGGSDGVVNIWDGVLRKRIRQFPQFEEEIASLAFSHDGRKLAIASSYTFDEGERDKKPDNIFIRMLGEDDCKPRTNPAGANGQ